MAGHCSQVIADNFFVMCFRLQRDVWFTRKQVCAVLAFIWILWLGLLVYLETTSLILYQPGILPYSRFLAFFPFCNNVPAWTAKPADIHSRSGI